MNDREEYLEAMQRARPHVANRLANAPLGVAFDSIKADLDLLDAAIGKAINTLDDEPK